MSVSGEFRRILADAVEGLREEPADGARELADRLVAAGESGDLAGAAERVLTLMGAEERLDDTTERLAAVCRIILGR